MGVKGATLNPGDSVVSMAIVKSEDMLLTVTENGYGKISNVADYRKTRRGSKGVITIKTGDRNGSVVCVRKVAIEDDIMVTSKQGKIIRMRVEEIRVTGRNAMGVRIMDVRKDDKITAVEPLVVDGDVPEEEGV
jgi:DNA gyrase subunit A